MRANVELAGRSTREMERAAKSPSRCSTRRSRLRSGWTQAGMVLLCFFDVVVDGLLTVWVEGLTEVSVPFDGGGVLVVMAAGGIMGWEWWLERETRQFDGGELADAAC